jgi:hypothetical protein
VPVEGPDGLPGLVELARNWLEQYGVSPEDRYRAARLLERQFQESGRFQYSLEGQPRAPNLDPVEDFVTKHSAGHCEYFASALALMLRSQGIPARMVVGFRTGEWNDLGGFFQVRQLHAHTWVEAFLEPRHVPSQLIHSDRRWDWSAGGWLRLDPTPSGADQMSLANRLLTRFDAYLSWLDYLWSNYITDMDQARQRRAVYEPTVEILKNTGRNLFDPAWWWRFVSSLVEIDINRWFRWQVGLASIVIMLAMVFAYRSLRRAGPWLLGRFVADRAKAAGRRPRVEFYRRLEAILARHGLVRDPWQTQREFAAAARVHLARTSGDGKLAGLPVEIAEAYYRVRFGRQSLDNDQVEAIEQALRQLVGHRSPARRAL